MKALLLSLLLVCSLTVLSLEAFAYTVNTNTILGEDSKAYTLEKLDIVCVSNRIYKIAERGASGVADNMLSIVSDPRCATDDTHEVINRELTYIGPELNFKVYDEELVEIYSCVLDEFYVSTNPELRPLSSEDCNITADIVIKYFAEDGTDCVSSNFYTEAEGEVLIGEGVCTNDVRADEYIAVIEEAAAIQAEIDRIAELERLEAERLAAEIQAALDAQAALEEQQRLLAEAEALAIALELERLEALRLAQEEADRLIQEALIASKVLIDTSVVIVTEIAKVELEVVIEEILASDVCQTVPLPQSCLNQIQKAIQHIITTLNAVLVVPKPPISVTPIQAPVEAIEYERYVEAYNIEKADGSHLWRCVDAKRAFLWEKEIMEGDVYIIGQDRRCMKLGRTSWRQFSHKTTAHVEPKGRGSFAKIRNNAKLYR